MTDRPIDQLAPRAAVALPSGARLPLLGFGTWQLSGGSGQRAIEAALEVGYRHLDTATMYRNEREVGRAIAASGVPRSEVFVTTKLLPSTSAAKSRAELEQGLRALGTGYVDLWLIHWPPRDGVGRDSWRELVRAQRDGLARDIGVSNYRLSAIDALARDSGVQPAVNQIPWSPLRFDPATLAGHRERGVVLEGYSPLLGGVLENGTVREVARRIGRTPAQVVIRWHLQHEIVVIPRSRNPQRIRQNADVASFELADGDMAALDALGR